MPDPLTLGDKIRVYARTCPEGACVTITLNREEALEIAVVFDQMDAVRRHLEASQAALASHRIEGNWQMAENARTAWWVMAVLSACALFSLAGL